MAKDRKEVGREEGTGLGEEPTAPPWVARVVGVTRWRPLLPPRGLSGAASELGPLKVY